MTAKQAPRHGPWRGGRKPRTRGLIIGRALVGRVGRVRTTDPDAARKFYAASIGLDASTDFDFLLEAL